ncbi:DNA polymerase III subunit gamma and tau [Cellulosimicrobium terreum]|uniref:DNA-directed DNA polymerase n=2 Tax=Cellulosimicrobium funkei TaxID=264251 RepID=A0A4Y8QYP2_9MICO|nr:DNA polymerase III subunit gamma and tau [Cellulosimicrobium funkei]TFF05127.1 DNA polymerase III subunit gamma and tau [Cellulosimicrobium funkei]TGA69522.1 DNA polymerase III subunit gamma and tau [Cellulosimicrobium terreum]
MSTALYRRYRPETFAEVIGQDHVTAPLMQALRSGRVNHAYLFSGPRGCGKTTSARILARTLNCERNTPESPLDTPCGQCPSCVELARGGPGSLDVVEIDAASHNGVDDARELRERAAFAPARDRYKIFILDEAHMVTPQGFNALLKLVEEPPEHVKFVFATTEPDKVIGTIRSRTHHYPFRLVPPDVLGPYLEELCAAEGVSIGSGVVPLVTRAGGGSVRDSLSVMDQLMAGAEDGAVEYERAVALLGFTHATLLDDVVDALAARDGASIFRVVDHVIATGHEPRRFVEDVLERLRDLIVIAVSGDEAQAVLRDQPADQLERMRTQAQHLGVAELSRAADLVNAALTEMTGATSPRLHLELLMARLLLPGADDGAAGFAARLDRLERGGLGNVVVPPAAGTPAPGDAAAATATAPAAAPAGAPSSGLTGAAAVRAALRPARPGQPAAAPASAPAPQDPTPVGRVAAPAAPEQDRPSGDASASPAAASPDSASPAAASRAADGAGSSAVDSAGSAVGSSAPTHSSAPREETAPAEASAPERTGPVSGAASAPPRTAPDAASGAGAGTTSVAESEAPDDGARETAASAASADAPSHAPEARHPEASRPEASREEAPREETPRPSTPREAAPRQEAAASSAPAAGGASPALTTEELRRRWPEVLENLRASPVTWSLVSANAQVAELGADVLYLAFPSPGLARTFSSSRHTSAVQDVVYQTLGLQVRVEPRLDEGGQAGGGSAPSSGPAPVAPAPSGGSAPSGPASPVATSSGPAASAPTAAAPAVPGPAGSASASVGAAALHGPGGSQAGTPVATVAAPSAPGAARSASTSRPADEAAEAHEAPRAAVALQERPSTETAPAPPRASSTVVDAADEAWLAGASVPASAPAPAPRVDSADEAWLAGLPAEPPVDLDDGPEPEPVLEPAPPTTPASTQAPARTAPSAATAPTAPGRPSAASPAASSQGAPARAAAPAAPASAGTSAAPLRGVSAARAAIAAARVPRPAEEPARRGEPSTADPMDDLPSADDPDIVSTGLVGTALVVSLLDGKIIEEIQDQG